MGLFGRNKSSNNGNKKSEYDTEFFSKLAKSGFYQRGVYGNADYYNKYGKNVTPFNHGGGSYTDENGVLHPPMPEKVKMNKNSELARLYCGAIGITPDDADNRELVAKAEMDSLFRIFKDSGIPMDKFLSTDKYQDFIDILEENGKKVHAVEVNRISKAMAYIKSFWYD